MPRVTTSAEEARAHQAVIITWMQHQLARLRWSPERWAREAHISPTTVTRAMVPGTRIVSSISTLCRLADAAGVPTVLDFLGGQASGALRYPVLNVMLEELLPAVGCDIPVEKVALLAEALGQAIAGMAQQPPESVADPGLARVLARGARAILNR